MQPESFLAFGSRAGKKPLLGFKRPLVPSKFCVSFHVERLGNLLSSECFLPNVAEDYFIQESERQGEDELGSNCSFFGRCAVRFGFSGTVFLANRPLQFWL